MKSLWVIVFFLAVAWTSPARAQDASRDSVQAAMENANDTLKQEVVGTGVSHEMTIGQLVEKVHGQDALAKALSSAQAIGGPRWLDEKTCQVRVELDGAKVAAAIEKMDRDAKQPPIPPDVLAPRLKVISARTFSAVGTSAAGDVSAAASSAAGWSAISRDARRAVVQAAKRDAAGRVIDSLRPIDLGNGRTAGDALAAPPVNEAMRNWLTTRPVTRLEFVSGGEVRVTLAATPDDVFAQFKQIATTQPSVALPKDEPAWQRVNESFRARMAAPIGRAAVTQPSVAAPKVVLPDVAPSWVNQQIDAQGTSAAKASKLKAARAAESTALVRLREQVDALQLTPTLTVGQAAKQDPKLAEAVARAVDSAQTYRVDYEPDGGAKVKVSLDLSQLWNELRPPGP